MVRLRVRVRIRDYGYKVSIHTASRVAVWLVSYGYG